jgi:putative membrane protein
MLAFFLALLIATGIGILLGTFTGLIPGLHVNTVALFIVAGYSICIALVSMVPGSNDGQVPLLVALVVTSLSITHTFLDFIPSTFLGVPDPDTALSVLPAHEMLLKGNGYRAVHLSAIGSLLALGIGCMICIPYMLLLGPPVYGYRFLETAILPILICLVTYMILSDPASVRGSHLLGRLPVLSIFLLAGLLGLVVLPLPARSPIGIPTTMLFPLFSGLFGLSTLLISLNDAENTEGFPEQTISPPALRMQMVKNAVPGTIAGSFVGFLPGVSSAHATLMAMLGTSENDPISEEKRSNEARGKEPITIEEEEEGTIGVGRKEPITIEEEESSGVGGKEPFAIEEEESSGIGGNVPIGIGRKELIGGGNGDSIDTEEDVIVTLGAVNTANALFVLVALFLTGKARSGAAVSIQQFLPIREWRLPISHDLVILLIAVIISGMIAFHLALAIGRLVAERINMVPYRLLLRGIIISIISLVILFNGPMGLTVLVIATATGIVPQVIGVRRSHLMGVLLIPVMFYYW